MTSEQQGATDCETTEAGINHDKMTTSSTTTIRLGEKRSTTNKSRAVDGSVRREGNGVETIELKQTPGATLGISIKGGVDHPFLVSKDDKALDTGIFVIHVYAGGAAAIDGRLRLGDRILHVNGVSVESVKQTDFLKILTAGTKRDEILRLTVKHNEALRRKLNARKTSIACFEANSSHMTPNVHSSNVAGGAFSPAPLNGVQMLTGNVGPRFEPLEACANANFEAESISATPQGEVLAEEKREPTTNVEGKRQVEVDGDFAKKEQEELTEEDDEDGDDDEVEEDEEEEETRDFENVSVWQKALFPVGAASLALMAVFILRRQMRD